MPQPDSSTGSEQPLDQIYRTHIDSMYSYARRLTGSAADAEDVVSDAMLDAVKTLRSGRIDELSEAWLRTAVRRNVIDLYRKREVRKRKAHLLRPEGGEEWAVTGERAEVEDVLGRLDPWLRFVLVENAVEKTPARQLAEESGKSVRAIESDIRRAKRKAREIYAEVEEAEER